MRYSGLIERWDITLCIIYYTGRQQYILNKPEFYQLNTGAGFFSVSGEGDSDWFNSGFISVVWIAFSPLLYRLGINSIKNIIKIKTKQKIKHYVNSIHSCGINSTEESRYIWRNHVLLCRSCLRVLFFSKSINMNICDKVSLKYYL